MRSRGGFVCLVGVFFLLALILLPQNWSNWEAVLLWGSISGFFSVAGNILLIEAMGKQSAGLCSTIYRFNMIFVVVGAFFLFGEKISPMQLAGIVLALLAILAFLPFGDVLLASKSGFYLAVIAAILRAGMGLSYKYAFNNDVDKNALIIVNSFWWILGGALYAFVREKKFDWIKDKKVLAYSAISGLLVAGIVFCMAGSVNLGDVSVVLPIAQMSFLITFILGVIFLHEKAGMKKIAALICGTAAILMLAYGGA